MREELILSTVKDWIEDHKLIINEGEERCPVCYGDKGYISHCIPPDSQWIVCKRCKGNGKIDWIRKAMMT